MKSVKYLQRLKDERKLPSDRQLALLLGKGTNTISQYMTGQRVMDDETCLAVAIELSIDPMLVVGAACVDRAEKTGQRSLWENFLMSRMATAAALLCFACVNLFLTPERAEAAPLQAVSVATNADHFVLCQMLRAWLRRRYTPCGQRLSAQHSEVNLLGQWR